WILVVDAGEGLPSLEEEVARRLRRVAKPVLLAANKADTAAQEALLADFYRLGMGTVFPVSAEGTRGVDALLEAAAALLPSPHAEEDEDASVRLAVVGRPNVGKSS